VTDGNIYLPYGLPYGQGRHAPIGGEDIARVAVGILTDPAAHLGKMYVPTARRRCQWSSRRAFSAAY
jgi:uncharacterized protein YbjT (DUF2867 family)